MTDILSFHSSLIRATALQIKEMRNGPVMVPLILAAV
jgi:hypothetical protein